MRINRSDRPHRPEKPSRHLLKEVKLLRQFEMPSFLLYSNAKPLRGRVNLSKAKDPHMKFIAKKFR